MRLHNKKRFLSVITVSFLFFFSMGCLVGFSLPSPTIQTVETVEPSAIEQVESQEEQFVISVTPEEIDLLARLVNAEAKGEHYEGMVAVANVVINRVTSDKWKADSVTEVIFEPRQFEPVSNGAIGQPATETSLKATLEALKGKSVVPDHVDCFATVVNDFSSWADPYGIIGNHKFWIAK